MKINEIYIEIGYQCNGKCDYCFQTRNKKDTKVASIEDNIDFIEQLYKKDLLTSTFSIMLYGGETFLYKDWVQSFLRGLAERKINVPIRITTNGVLLTKENIDFLIKYKLTPTISVDGGFLTFEEHRHFSISSKQLYHQIKDCVEICHQNNIYPTCQSTFTPNTIGKLFESYLFVRFLGFKRWWYELECLSEISYNKWTKMSLQIYRNQIDQVLKANSIGPEIEILDLKQLLEKYKFGRFLINPHGNIVAGTIGIIHLDDSNNHFLTLGNIYDGIDFKKMEDISSYVDSPVSFKRDECEKCHLKYFCTLTENHLGEIQDITNCKWWKILSEAYNGR